MWVACNPGDGADPERQAVESRPLNVLLITLDTTRADALGIYGNERLATPEIDRFAARGVVFDRAYTAQPSTLPAHATIMTGRMPFAHGARANAGYVLPSDNETLAEVFAKNGYVTAAEIAAPVIGRETQLDQGFQHYRDLDSFDIRLKSVQVLRDDEFHGQDLFERDAIDITSHGANFIRVHADDPFFLWLHYFDPHAFYAPPPPWNSRFSDAPYFSEIHFMDYHVGKLLAELRHQGIAERTLVVITADHGEGLGEHGELTHSYYVYDSTMRVPLIVALPGTLEPGRRVAQPVRTADIAPTVLELAGLPPLNDIQGVSLAPLLFGRSLPPELDAYGESFEPLAMFGTNVLRFIRHGRWKYIHKVNPQLFDLSEDDGELVNLATEKPQVVEELRERLLAWVRGDYKEREDNRTTIDAETLQQLAALGYMGEGAPVDFEEEDDLEEFRGVDPNTRMSDMEAYATAFGAIRSGNFSLAKKQLDPLYAANPESLPILRGLLSSLEGDERLERAPALLEVAKRLEPENPLYFIQAADLYQELGDEARSEQELRQALVLEPCNATARVVLAARLREWGRSPEQSVVLKEGVRDCDENLDFMNDLAYVLATSHDPKLRNGKKALQLARNVLDRADVKRPDYIDTFACALAEVGNFRKAVIQSRRALDMIKSRKFPEEIVSTYREHLELFEAGQPVRSEPRESHLFSPP
jgi:arylsulfatase A-like enzyme